MFETIKILHYDKICLLLQKNIYYCPLFKGLRSFYSEFYDKRCDDEVLKLLNNGFVGIQSY